MPFGRDRGDPWEREVRNWPSAIHWVRRHSPSDEISVGRRDALMRYLTDLQSGRWGQVLKIWFDEPRQGDIPWEPCALTLLHGAFVVVSEDFTARPTRLRQYATHEVYGEAIETVRKLRPWGIDADDLSAVERLPGD